MWRLAFDLHSFDILFSGAFCLVESKKHSRCEIESENIIRVGFIDLENYKATSSKEEFN